MRSAQRRAPGPAASVTQRATGDLAELAACSVASHPLVLSVELAGSRARGTHHELSDWDFAVTTSDFDALAADLPVLVKPLAPLAAQWEPLGNFPVYMLLLPGPLKVEYLFLDRTQEPRPPLRPSAATLPAIDARFWDWIWWIATKHSIGREDLLQAHWPQLYRHILQPMGADGVPDSVEAAICAYVARRSELERRFDVALPDDLQREVRRGIRRLRAATALSGRSPP